MRVWRRFSSIEKIRPATPLSSFSAVIVSRGSEWLISSLPSFAQSGTSLVLLALADCTGLRSGFEFETPCGRHR